MGQHQFYISCFQLLPVIIFNQVPHDFNLKKAVLVIWFNRNLFVFDVLGKITVSHRIDSLDISRD